MKVSLKNTKRKKRSTILSKFLSDRFVELTIIGLIIFFSVVAVHLLWLLIGHPDSPLLDKGFEMFSGAVTTLIGALVMKLTPDKRR